VSVYKHDEFDENGDPIELTFVKKQSNDDETDVDDDEEDEDKNLLFVCDDEPVD
jgi:hypothetical protein